MEVNKLLEENKIGVILLVNNPIEEAMEYHKKLGEQKSKLFCANDFSIDLARSVIEEGYIASNGTKIILIAAESFNIAAQNALLKILEEPPSGVKFVLIARLKSSLLPTIKSRLILLNHTQKKRLPAFPLDIANLNLSSVYEFLKEVSKNPNEYNLKELIQSLYMESLGLPLKQEELEYFDRAITWSMQYERAHYVLGVLLLMLLRVKNAKRF
ncbi:DNA polymerase III subunit delta' [Helicobacter burdigaliensis]|uniref:DNA polymerase III subunit delta' n=1 Tax=Helicobacter burdigaliensis TaxID=2315334 RepID=UPI000EF6B4B1|nr:DNA polymerase III subunit delta' [Helicobacter burdigaliensis]